LVCGYIEASENGVKESSRRIIIVVVKLGELIEPRLVSVIHVPIRNFAAPKVP
jgi:hypothetical protein